MEEKRNIKIDLATAKKWYEGDNKALKELALKAFKVSEIVPPKPMDWEDFCRENRIEQEYYIGKDSVIVPVTNSYRSYISDSNLLATRDDAVAVLSLIKLIRLRDAWLKSCYYDSVYSKAIIYDHSIDVFRVEDADEEIGHFFCFYSYDDATAFLKAFGCLFDLIKPLYK